MREIHEFWANIIQIAIATYLLSIQIGLAASGPIIVAVISTVATVLMSPVAQRTQVGWMVLVQKRVGQLTLFHLPHRPVIPSLVC